MNLCRQAEAFMIDFQDGTTSIVEGFDLVDAVRRLGCNEERTIVTVKRLRKRVLDIMVQHDKLTESDTCVNAVP